MRQDHCGSTGSKVKARQAGDGHRGVEVLEVLQVDLKGDDIGKGGC